MPTTKQHAPYAEQIGALTEISRAITSDLYLDDILTLVVSVTAKVMDSKICSLWLVDEKKGELKLRATQTISKEYLKERSLKLGEGVVGTVAKKNIPMSIYNVLKKREYKEKEMARKEKLSSMLSVPLVVKEKVIGVINCYSQRPRRFSEVEVYLLTSVASQAAVAIENTELMVKTRVIQEELEARKLVDRAKEMLMTKKGLSGAAAFRRMQKMSMNTRKPMRDIAEAILLAEEI